jgi:hypothetical protein
MIDEKSMTNLKTLSLIDDRLRAILPASSDRPFGGLNVLLGGDFLPTFRPWEHDDIP